jgi:hypothetical protein
MTVILTVSDSEYQGKTLQRQFSQPAGQIPPVRRSRPQYWFCQQRVTRLTTVLSVLAVPIDGPWD